jgi:hypothetical protein
MTFDNYQACLNALFAADRQLNLVQARFAASGAAGATLDAFQLLRLAMVQCLERLEQQYARQYPDHELPDVCALLGEQGDAGGNFKTPVEWPVLFICHSNPEKPPHACQTATRHL